MQHNPHHMPDRLLSSRTLTYTCITGRRLRYKFVATEWVVYAMYDSDTDHHVFTSLSLVFFFTFCSITKIPGAGGGNNFGYLARITNAHPHFQALPPFGGTPCGVRTKPSVTASHAGCAIAVNGGPFDMSTGACMGASCSCVRKDHDSHCCTS